MSQEEDYLINMPEPSDWECVLCGGETEGEVILRPSKGGEPNAFHRIMQRLAFGFRWRKAK